MSTKQTPLPWTAEPVLDTRHEPSSLLARTVEIGGHPDHNGGHAIAICVGPDRVANAAVIVRAVSHHAELVAALWVIANQFANLADAVRKHYPIDAAAENALKKAKEVLAKLQTP